MITKEMLKQFVRYEISYEEMIRDEEQPVRFEENCKTYIGDLLTACYNLRDREVGYSDYIAWFTLIMRDLYEVLGLNELLGENYDGSDEIFVPTTLQEAAVNLCAAMDRIAVDPPYTSARVFNEPIERVENFYLNQSLPRPMWKVTDGQKETFIQIHMLNEVLRTLTPNELELYRAYVEEGCEKGWETALYAKGYGSYEKDVAFGKDDETARACLEKLIEIRQDPDYYCTLGDIAAEGGSRKEPDYGKAFQYYTASVSVGGREAKYKLAELFMEGKGVVKCTEGAMTLLQAAYDETGSEFCGGSDNCCFAEAAYRLADAMAKSAASDPQTRYSMLLEADYAIRRRLMKVEDLRDLQILAKIRTARREMERKAPKEYLCEQLDMDTPGPILQLLQGNGILQATLTRTQDDRCILKASQIRKGDGAPRALFNAPRFGICRFIEEVELQIKGVSDLSMEGRTGDYVIGEIRYNDKNRLWELCYHTVPMVSFRCKGFFMERRSLEKPVSGPWIGLVYLKDTDGHFHMGKCGEALPAVGEKGRITEDDRIVEGIVVDCERMPLMRLGFSDRLPGEYHAE